MLIEKQGVHGTSKESADQISREGFKLSENGWMGKGVYFWHDGFHSRNLAKGYYLSKKLQRAFVSQVQGQCAIVSATICVDDGSYLDFEKPKMKDKIALVAHVQNIGQTREEIAALHVGIIKKIEEKSKITVKAFEVRMSYPRNSATTCYPLKAIGYPVAIIVRDVTCIAIDAVEECPA